MEVIKIEAQTNSTEVVEEEAEAAIKDGSPKANRTTADKDSSEGSDDSADFNTTAIFHVNTFNPARVVKTEYMTLLTENVSKIISPGKDSNIEAAKATKVNKKGTCNTNDREISTNKKDDKTVKNDNNIKIRY